MKAAAKIGYAIWNVKKKKLSIEIRNIVVHGHDMGNTFGDAKRFPCIDAKKKLHLCLFRLLYLEAGRML